MAGRKKLEGAAVDYFQLPRKQLQSLCKKYGFPANKTNLRMAEFLTSHLNSEEFLNRDKSVPSPAVKTRFQCRDEESTTDDTLPAISDLPAISELRATASETQAQSHFHDVIEIEAEQSSTHAPKASEAEVETGCGPLQTIPVPAIGLPVEEGIDFTNSGFKIRDSCQLFKTEFTQGSPVYCSVFVASTAVDSGIQHFSVKCQKPPGEETPLPVSTMPHVRPTTPDGFASSDEKGAELFVELNAVTGMSLGENLTDDYRVLGDPVTSSTEQAELPEDVISASLSIFERSEGQRSSRLESQVDKSLNRTAAAENISLQASTPSMTCKATDSTALKSSLLTPNRKSSEKILDQSNDIPCSYEEEPENDELAVKNLNKASPYLQNSLAKKLLEGNERTPPKFAADLDSPPEGIVEKVVNICKDPMSSVAPLSSQRKESYKSSPFMKSSRIAAELDRASKLGQTRRVGILASRRGMGVAPLFSDSAMEDVEKESRRGGASPSPVSKLSHVEEDFAGKAKNCSTPFLESADHALAQDKQVSETRACILDMEVELTSKSLPPITESLTRDEGMMLSIDDGNVDKDEQTTVARFDPSNVAAPLDAAEAAKLPARVAESVTNMSWMTQPIQLPTRRPVHCKLKEKSERPFSTNGRTLELMERQSAKLKMLRRSASVKEEGVISRPKKSTSVASADELKIRGEPSSELLTVEQDPEDPATRLEKGLDRLSELEEVNLPGRRCPRAEAESCTAGVANEDVGQNCNTIEPLPTEGNNVCEEDSVESEENKSSEIPQVPLTFLEIDFAGVSVGKPIEVQQPARVIKADSAKVTRESITADISTSPMSSRILAVDKQVLSSSNMVTPSKLSGILSDVVTQSEEKNNANSLQFYGGKENEWSWRQEQHKSSPFAGRAKEKAIRTAENASNLREQLLRKRRGIFEQEQTDRVENIELSSLQELATNRLL